MLCDERNHFNVMFITVFSYEDALHLLPFMNKFWQFFRGKCPRCGEGKVFESPNPYNISKMLTTNHHCSHCNLNFIPEPGFYWGSTYVVYALTVAFSGFNFGVSWVFFGFMKSLSLEYVLINAALLIIFSPIFFRFSRMLWLWAFYDREQKQTA